MTFARWFEEQHGKRPSRAMAEDIRSEGDGLIAAGRRKHLLAAQVDEWDTRRTSAQWAWSAAIRSRNGAR